MDTPRCARCLFCEEYQPDYVVCTNADLAHENGWEGDYMTQGFLELPKPDPADPPCFWFVERR